MTDGGFRHRLPFGAELTEAGVRFRLWAPDVAGVGLRIDGDEPEPMESVEGGWFELETEKARAGSRYAYVMPDGLAVPDPASRSQAEDVHGDSMVVDPAAYHWTNAGWRGRPFEEVVLYETHVGTWTEEGTFRAGHRRLADLADLGITAIELLPVSDFPGKRNWGYDGVLPFAPDRAYGMPDDLKALVDAAHGHGLMVFLDVVYNHFGPDGNYLHVYAPSFFTEKFSTPWGAAIDFARPEVRSYFIENTLYWLEEYRFDGIRFDAVHAIEDESEEHFLTELSRTVRERITERPVHLFLENDDNIARWLDTERPPTTLFDAQWNDDYHHVAHVVATGESGGYYADYAEAPVDRLVRSLSEGFVYQGDPSAFRNGARRGEVSAGLPTQAFVNFIQNHDQIGNRAFGERLTTLAPAPIVEALTVLTLLAPSIPMLYMGEEYGETRPFQFFTDFGDELAEAVREGRRREFGGFAEFADPAARARIPDPNDPATFRRSRLDPEEGDAERRELVRTVLAIRALHVVPLIRTPRIDVVAERFAKGGLSIRWRFEGGSMHILANLSDEERMVEPQVKEDLVFRMRNGADLGAHDVRLFIS